MNEIYETKLNVILFSRYESNTFDELLLKILKKRPLCNILFGPTKGYDL